jgi:hypothetical protein
MNNASLDFTLIPGARPPQYTPPPRKVKHVLGSMEKHQLIMFIERYAAELNGAPMPNDKHIVAMFSNRGEGGLSFVFNDRHVAHVRKLLGLSAAQGASAAFVAHQAHQARLHDFMEELSNTRDHISQIMMSLQSSADRLADEYNKGRP